MNGGLVRFEQHLRRRAATRAGIVGGSAVAFAMVMALLGLPLWWVIGSAGMLAGLLFGGGIVPARLRLQRAIERLAVTPGKARTELRALAGARSNRDTVRFSAAGYLALHELDQGRLTAATAALRLPHFDTLGVRTGSASFDLAQALILGRSLEGEAQYARCSELAEVLRGLETESSTHMSQTVEFPVRFPNVYTLVHARTSGTTSTLEINDNMIGQELVARLGPSQDRSSVDHPMRKEARDEVSVPTANVLQRPRDDTRVARVLRGLPGRGLQAVLHLGFALTIIGHLIDSTTPPLYIIVLWVALLGIPFWRRRLVARAVAPRGMSDAVWLGEMARANWTTTDATIQASFYARIVQADVYLESGNLQRAHEVANDLLKDTSGPKMESIDLGPVASATIRLLTVTGHTQAAAKMAQDALPQTEWVVRMRRLSGKGSSPRALRLARALLADRKGLTVEASQEIEAAHDEPPCNFEEHELRLYSNVQRSSAIPIESPTNTGQNKKAPHGLSEP